MDDGLKHLSGTQLTFCTHASSLSLDKEIHDCKQLHQNCNMWHEKFACLWLSSLLLSLFQWCHACFAFHLFFISSWRLMSDVCEHNFHACAVPSICFSFLPGGWWMMCVRTTWSCKWISLFQQLCRAEVAFSFEHVASPACTSFFTQASNARVTVITLQTQQKAFRFNLGFFQFFLASPFFHCHFHLWQHATQWQQFGQNPLSHAMSFKFNVILLGSSQLHSWFVPSSRRLPPPSLEWKPSPHKHSRIKPRLVHTFLFHLHFLLVLFSSHLFCLLFHHDSFIMVLPFQQEHPHCFTWLPNAWVKVITTITLQTQTGNDALTEPLQCKIFLALFFLTVFASLLIPDSLFSTGVCSHLFLTAKAMDEWHACTAMTVSSPFLSWFSVSCQDSPSFTLALKCLRESFTCQTLQMSMGPLSLSLCLCLSVSVFTESNEAWQFSSFESWDESGDAHFHFFPFESSSPLHEWSVLQWESPFQQRQWRCDVHAPPSLWLSHSFCDAAATAADVVVDVAFFQQWESSLPKHSNGHRKQCVHKHFHFIGTTVVSFIQDVAQNWCGSQMSHMWIRSECSCINKCGFTLNIWLENRFTPKMELPLSLFTPQAQERTARPKRTTLVSFHPKGPNRTGRGTRFGKTASGAAHSEWSSLTGSILFQICWCWALCWHSTVKTCAKVSFGIV